MSSEELEAGSAPAAKKARLTPSPGPSPSTSWTPSVPEPEYSCDSGLSESSLSVATPPVQEEEGEAGEEEVVDGAGPSVEDEDSLSGLSDMSGQEWKPDMSSKLSWLHSAMRRGEDPRGILINLLPSGSEIPELLDNMTMWKVLFNLLSEPPRRKKLEQINTLEDCVDLIKKSSNIIVLTGAGVSVSCGIPDFRSRDGVYARLAVDFPDLPDPQAMFDIHYFKKDPRPFFKFAREIYPGQFQPSPCHKFIRCVETSGKLLRNYTQNIDTLEQVAGIENVIQCHGSFATASCMVCRRKVDAESIRGEIFNQTIPKCGQCPEPEETPPPTDPFEADQFLPAPPPPVQLPVMKPDIVFFGEGLPDHFHNCISRDKSQCDLLIVIGSSLKVRPVALIPSSLPPEVPQILINRETLPHLTFDVELLGDCDRIVNQLCLMLEEDGWQAPVHQPRLVQHIGLPTAVTTSSSSQQPPPPPHSSDSVQAQPSQTSENSLGELVSVPGDSEQRVPTEENTEGEPQQPLAEPTENGTEDVEKEKCSSNVAETDEVEEFKLKSLADFIPEGKFLYLPPSRYIFPGAEIYHDDSDDEEDAEEEEDDEDEGEEEEEEVENNENEEKDESVPAEPAVTVENQTMSPTEEI